MSIGYTLTIVFAVLWLVFIAVDHIRKEKIKRDALKKVEEETNDNFDNLIIKK